MTDKKFITTITELYKEARLTTFPAVNIKRGKSHSISSKAEDLFALYISKIVDKKTLIFVDQPLSFRFSGKSKTIYADIALVKDSKVYQIWDLKTDLGWKRDSFIQFCKAKIEFVKRVRNQKVKLKDGENKNEQFLSFAKDLTFNIAVISSENISKAKGTRNIARTRKLINVGVYFLTSDVHPNDYKYSVKQLVAKITLNYKNFKYMRQRIKTNE